MTQLLNALLHVANLAVTGVIDMYLCFISVGLAFTFI